MDTAKDEFEGVANELLRWTLSTLQSREYLATAKRDDGGQIISVTISKIFNPPTPLDSDPRRAHTRDRRRTKPL